MELILLWVNFDWFLILRKSTDNAGKCKSMTITNLAHTLTFSFSGKLHGKSITLNRVRVRVRSLKQKQFQEEFYHRTSLQTGPLIILPRLQDTQTSLLRKPPGECLILAKLSPWFDDSHVGLFAVTFPWQRIGRLLILQCDAFFAIFNETSSFIKWLGKKDSLKRHEWV